MSKIVLEIREGVGGEEASLFALELMQMYQACAAKQKWKVKVLNSTPYEERLVKMMKEAIARGEEITIEIV